MNLAQLRARLKALTGELDVLTTKDAMTAEDITAIEAKTVEIEEVEKSIGILEKAEAAKARSAAPVNAPAGSEQRTVPAQAKKDLTTAEKIGTMVFCMAKSYQEEDRKSTSLN